MYKNYHNPAIASTLLPNGKIKQSKPFVASRQLDLFSDNVTFNDQVRLDLDAQGKKTLWCPSSCSGCLHGGSFDACTL